MPDRIVLPIINILNWSSLFVAGGLGMLAEQQAIQIITTTVSLIVASTAVFFYKKWLENRYKDNCKCDKKDETNKKL